MSKYYTTAVTVAVCRPLLVLLYKEYACDTGVTMGCNVLLLVFVVSSHCLFVA